MDAAIVGADYLKTMPAYGHRLAAPRHMAEAMRNQAADGIELVVAEIGAEMLVEVFDRRQRLNDAVAVLVLEDVGVFVEVVLVINLTDDLLDHVLDGHQLCQAAVFVHDHRHVIAAFLEQLEQRVKAFALGDEQRRTQQFAHVELAGVVAEITQKVLRDEDADDVIAAFADDGEARIAGFDDGRQQLSRVIDPRQHRNLGAWDHDVSGLQLRDVQHALDHRQRIRIEQTALMSITKKLEEIVLIFRLTPTEHLAQTFEPGFLATVTRCVLAHEAG